MTGKTISRVWTEVKALRIVLMTLLIFYGVGFIGALITTVTAIVAPGFIDVYFRDHLSFLLEFGLAGPVYFFIGYYIFRLLDLAISGESFNPATPRHVRRIAYAVFILALINAVANALSSELTVFSWASFLGTALRLLYGGLTKLLLGFGFLVIARVIEAGVRLQQDQNLTV